MSNDRLISENKRRNAILDAEYNPFTGYGSLIPRQKVTLSDIENDLLLPIPMLNIDWVDFLFSKYKSLHDAAKGTGSQIEDVFSVLTSERFKHDFEFWAATCIKILEKDTFVDIPFILRGAQRTLLNEMEAMRVAMEPIRIVLLKARQWGGSTLVQIYMMWIQQVLKNNWHLAVCAQDDNAAKNINGMYSNAANKYPKEIGKITLKPYERSSKNRICKETGGILGVGSINNPDQFRSYNFAMIHLCINPNTEIPTKNGFTKFAKDLSIGDSIITHTGENTTVKNVTISKPCERNGNGKSIIIKAWGQQPIELTPNHPVFTDKGWVKADEITTHHLLSYPVRKITSSITSIQLPVYENKRKQGGGTIPSGSGKTIYINKEIGYAFGYYLAEGSVHRKKNTLNEVTFSRDKDDFRLAERAIRALSGISSKIRTERSKTSRTEHDIINDAVLAKWMFETFGMKEDKTLPDWFFNCGNEFLEGVLIGYLSGDGSKSNSKQDKYELASMSATSISSSIAMQIRDISIALGVGIASVDIKEQGLLYGRNCKKAYNIRWAGSSARKLREILGYNVPENGKINYEKSFISNGFVWIKIKNISTSIINEVVDIEVEHPDHSFRTISCSVKNSEVGIWEDTPKRTAQSLITSLKETVPDVPYSVIVEESTAKGLNYFYDSWKKAVKGNTRYKAVFIPWWKIDRDRIKIDVDLNEFINNMSDYDRQLWQLGATLEGINWYNKHKADRYEEADAANQSYSEWQMQQENPSTPEEAFRSAGEKRFNPKYVSAMEADCMPPAIIADVQADSTQGKKSLSNIEFVPNNKGRLSIWALPDTSIKVSDRYVAFADIGGVWKGADYNVLKVLDRYWMMERGDPETVAVWYGHEDKDLFGWICAQICTKYDNALLAFETNSYDKDRRRDDHFMTVVEKIAEFYPNLYIRNKPDRVGDDYVPIYGFHTNSLTKNAMIDDLYGASRERYNKDLNKKDGYCLIERDIRAIKEMNWYEKKEDGTLGAMEGQKDDHVMATAGAFHIAVTKMPLPVEIINRPQKRRILKSEAHF